MGCIFYISVDVYRFTLNRLEILPTMYLYYGVVLFRNFITYPLTGNDLFMGCLISEFGGKSPASHLLWKNKRLSFCLSNPKIRI